MGSTWADRSGMPSWKDNLRETVSYTVKLLLVAVAVVLAVALAPTPSSDDDDPCKQAYARSGQHPSGYSDYKSFCRELTRVASDQ